MKQRFSLSVITFTFILSFSTLGLPADYTRLSAEEKERELWREIKASQYEEALPDVNFHAALRSLISVMKGTVLPHQLAKTFDHSSDVMPEGRIKFIHGLGTVLLLRYRAAEVKPAYGLLGEASTPVVARLSLAGPTIPDFIPGAAFKFLIDAKPSRNIVAMPSLDGQGEDHNFFRHPFRTDLPPIQSARLTIEIPFPKLGDGILGPDISIEKHGSLFKELFLRVFEKIFATVHRTPRHLPVNHLFSIHRSGDRVETAATFYKLEFIASPEAKKAYLASDEDDYRNRLADLKAGTELFQVFGYEFASSAKPILLGSLFVEAPAIASEFGDKHLFFQHHR